MGLKFNYEDGQTPLDEDEKEGLKINTISTQGELNDFEQLNIEKAVEWSLHLNLSSDKILTEQFIKDLHQKMYSDVWKWAGKFRKSNKNIGVDWTIVAIELNKLLENTKYWIKNEVYSPEEIAIRFKHELVSIHCFPNGNGRHSRLMADIIMANIFGKNVFTWNHSNMVKADESRREYINALKIADNGVIIPLIKFASS